MKGIRNPFKSFEKRIKLGVVKQGCFGCEGCYYEQFGSSVYPCSECSHNAKNRNKNAENKYTKKL